MILLFDSEVLGEQRLPTSHTLVGEHDRLGLGYGVGDPALLMKPIHHVPVVPLPRSSAATLLERREGQKSKRKAALIN